MRKSYIPSVGELEAFCACARVGTTTGAAQEIGLTQSAVSRSVAALEDRLGVALFTRARQRLALSDAGRAFLPEARAILTGLDAAATSVMAFGGARQVLRMAVLPSFARAWLIPRLGAYQKTHPKAGFDISARLDRVDFTRHPFDMAIQRSVHRTEGTRALPLATERLVAVAVPELLPGNRLDDAPDQAPLLQQSTRPTLWPDWFREAGLDPRQALRGARFDHFDMVLDAALAGLGIALVPEVIARAQLASGALVTVSDRQMATGEDYLLITPERTEALPGYAEFRNWLLDSLDRETGTAESTAESPAENTGAT